MFFAVCCLRVPTLKLYSGLGLVLGAVLGLGLGLGLGSRLGLGVRVKCNISVEIVRHMSLHFPITCFHHIYFEVRFHLIQVFMGLIFPLPTFLYLLSTRFI